MHIEIKHRWTEAVLFAGDYENAHAAILAAYKAGANLRGADLRDADLRDANLGFKPDETLPLRVARTITDSNEALDMAHWHTCETTHCLAGWAVHLSGAAGYALETVTGGTATAGALLMPSAAHLFYATNREAMEWAEDVIAANENQKTAK